MLTATVLSILSFSMGRCGSGEGGRGHQAGSNGDKLRKPRRTVQHLDVQSGAETSRILLTVSLNWAHKHKQSTSVICIWFRLCGQALSSQPIIYFFGAMKHSFRLHDSDLISIQGFTVYTEPDHEAGRRNNPVICTRYTHRIRITRGHTPQEF